jgi:hypothetical protein
MRRFFAQYHRVIVIDDGGRPYFNEQRLADYVTVHSRKMVGKLSVLDGSPL